MNQPPKSTSIKSQKPPADLSRKLGLIPGMRLCLLEPSSPARSAIQEALPSSITLDESLHPGVSYDLILFWPLSLINLPERFNQLARGIQPNGAIWAVMPKKKFAPGRGVHFSWEQMQAAGLTTDLVDNKVASIGDEDYGTRFVIRKDRRHSYQPQSAPPQEKDV